MKSAATLPLHLVRFFASLPHDRYSRDRVAESGGSLTLKDPFSVEGKVTIVTGGGTGIGESIAKEFAARGAPVRL